MSQPITEAGFAPMVILRTYSRNLTTILDNLSDYQELLYKNLIEVNVPLGESKAGFVELVSDMYWGIICRIYDAGNHLNTLNLQVNYTVDGRYKAKIDVPVYRLKFWSTIQCIEVYTEALDRGVSQISGTKTTTFTDTWAHYREAILALIPIVMDELSHAIQHNNAQEYEIPPKYLKSPVETVQYRPFPPLPMQSSFHELFGT